MVSDVAKHVSLRLTLSLLLPIPTVAGCGLPVSVRGSRSGSYHQINPQLQTVVTSFAKICNALNNAPVEWWKEPTPKELSNVNLHNQTFSTQKASRKDYDDDSDDNDNESDEEELEGEVVNLQSEETSPPLSFKKRRLNSPPDSQETEAFTIPNECPLPSQSPMCSPIPHEVSMVESENEQEEPTTLKPCTPNKPHPSGENEGQSSAAHNTNGPIRIFLATELSLNDLKTVTDLVERKQVEVVEEDFESDKGVIAVCGNAAMETGDGFLVNRTYGFLLSIGRGIPVVNSSYLTDLGGDLRMHQIIGDVYSSEWMAPQRAQGKRGALLKGYSVVLFGQHDTLAKIGDNPAGDDDVYSVSRMATLLKLCGAQVYSQSEYNASKVNSQQTVLMIRPNPKPRDWRAACSIAVNDDNPEKDPIPIICGNWLLDCISDYCCKDVSAYTKSRFNK